MQHGQGTAREVPIQPTRPLTRAVMAAATMFVAAVGSQFVFPGLILLILYVCGPIVLGILFASPNGTRETISANGYTAALAGGLAGATWIATHPGDMHVMSVIVSCFVSFVILSVVSGFVVYLVARRFPGAGEAREPRQRVRFRSVVDDDDE